MVMYENCWCRTLVSEPKLNVNYYKLHRSLLLKILSVVKNAIFINFLYASRKDKTKKVIIHLYNSFLVHNSQCSNNMIFFEPLLFILLLFNTSTLLSFSLFPSCYLFSTSPQFFLLIPFFSLPPPPFSFSFLILGLRSLIKLGGTRVWRRGGSK